MQKTQRHKQIQKAALAMVVLGIIIVGTVCVQTFFVDRVQSERFTSLGTPKIVDLDPKAGEQKVIMNDPSIQKNWGLMGTGGATDIKAGKAWEITQGDREVIVAIVDTGIDINHPDIKNNLWTNKAEAEGKPGVDDDKNGFVDDIHGYDFVNNTGDLRDNHGHGTHIAGIIGAEGGNGIGISGVAPKVRLMILKYYDPASKGNDNLKNTIRAVKYAIDKKANIINYSGGGTEPDDNEFRAIAAAKEAGILFVAAAGNERSNSDKAHYYPADYNLSNIISVTAINPFGQVLESSNFGVKTVNIAAPGEGIYSTLPGGKYGTMTGTSQATAFVSGVAALVLSHNKEFNFDQVKKQILSTADEIPGLRDKTSTSGKLNSYAALAIQPSISAMGAIAVDSPSPRYNSTTSALLSDDATAEARGRIPLASIVKTVKRAGASQEKIEKIN
jgi:subtilisin family serine protease